MKRRLVRFAGLLLWTMAASRTPAALVDSSWANPAASGSWGTAGNWSPSGIPDNGTDTYDVTITLNSGVSISLDISPTIRNLIYNAGNSSIREGSGTGSLTIQGTFTWNSGTLRAFARPVTYNAIGGGSLTASSSVTLGGTALTTLGVGGNSVFTHSGSGGVTFGSGTAATVLNIDAGSTWLNTGAGSFTTTGTGPRTVNNHGTFRKSTSSGISTIAPAFNNTGAVEVEAGTMNFSGAYSQNGSEASLELAGGNVTTSGALTIEGGMVTGSGSITGGSVLLGAATVAPGETAGTLVFTSLSATPTSVFQMDIGGLNAGTEYDQIIATGALALGGTLDVSFVNGFENTIRIGDTFTLLSASGGLSGTFAGLGSGDTLTVSGRSFVANYGANDLTLRVTAVPEPMEHAFVLGACLLGYVLVRRRVDSRR